MVLNLTHTPVGLHTPCILGPLHPFEVFMLAYRTRALLSLHLYHFILGLCSNNPEMFGLVDVQKLSERKRKVEPVHLKGILSTVISVVIAVERHLQLLVLM